ncbi:PAS domain-containing protein [Haloarcula quadrata]|uniref:PAS domain-containing protein n=1 Tax=Haloarcula quadrata TaxID=182779 RepID=UPI000EAE0736|nr:PAS domain-containing protein [Haloarcula quadrata]
MQSNTSDSGDYTLGPSISEAVTEEERLRAERDHWKHLFDQLVEQFPEPALAVDNDGLLTHWNDVQAEFHGVDSEVAKGEVAHEIIGTDDVTETLAEEVTRTGEPVRETDVRSGTHDDGTNWHVRATAVPLVSPTGDVVGAFEYVSRVTDLVEQRKSMRTVQKQVQGELETTVTDLESAAEQVTTNAEEIADIADEEAAHIDDVDDEIQTLSATTEEVASSVETISTQGEEAETLAEESEDATEELLETLNTVTAASEQMAADADSLASRVDEIDAVVTTINDLAEQTAQLNPQTAPG